jgi:GxxExxY protein
VSELILKDESFAVMGACFEVYNELGPGFLEAVYHEALEHEFAERGIPFVSKPRLLIRFKTHTLTTPYEADFLCFEQIVLEIKSARETEPKHESQLIHYLEPRTSSLEFSSISATTPTSNTNALPEPRPTNHPPDSRRFA